MVKMELIWQYSHIITNKVYQLLRTAMDSVTIVAILTILGLVMMWIAINGYHQKTVTSSDETDVTYGTVLT